MKSQLNIVVALACEARALIDYYRLKKMENSSHFSVYVNSEKNIYLIISGVGKVFSAAAVGYLHALTGAGKNTVYLNIGIAGGGARAVGELCVVHKIEDVETRKKFYPWRVFDNRFLSAELLTVSAPQEEYPALQLMDMEGSAFFQAATQCVTLEQVQAVKIVSDDSVESSKNITAARVIEWVSQQLPAIAKMIEGLLKFSEQQWSTLPVEVDVNEMVGRWRFTDYQRRQLLGYLQRIQVLSPQTEILHIFSGAKGAAEILEKLNEFLCRPFI